MESRKEYVPHAFFVLANTTAVNLVKAAGSCDIEGTVVQQQSLSRHVAVQQRAIKPNCSVPHRSI